MITLMQCLICDIIAISVDDTKNWNNSLILLELDSMTEFYSAR